MITSLSSELFPSPREIFQEPGYFTVPEQWLIFGNDSVIKEIISVSPFPFKQSEKNCAQIVLIHTQLDEEAFIIECETSKISISFGSPKGALYGLKTLKQIIDLSAGKIPCFKLTDAPYLKRRGFMLDVSRCKVPTMQTMYELIDLLSDLRYNELQLYIEHTFAFKDHDIVWQDFSPLTGEEIEQIDQYCQERFIELVPNLNSFGHFERWLRHKPYKQLAECPEGFRRDDPFMVRDHGSVLKPNQNSLDFIDSLYDEYLPHFSSKKFNVGLDEPWELGQGWSKPKVEKHGKHKVYLKHLEGILSLVEKHDKSMEFWADVILENPENAQHLPSHASPIIWGYEGDHPFSSQAKSVAECGLNFSLAPGTANWRSFSGRWETVRKNLHSACTNADEYGAEGILLTTWGDCGNHQPWSTMYPPLFLGSQLTWRGKDVNDEKIGTFIDRTVFHSPALGLGQALIDLAKLDQIIGFNLPNNSLPWFALFSAQPEKLPQHLTEQLSVHELQNGLDWLNKISSENFSSENNPNAKLAELEWKLGIDLSIAGINHAICMISKGINSSKIANNQPPLKKRFQDIWLQRARIGGLHEALSLLEKALQN